MQDTLKVSSGWGESLPREYPNPAKWDRSGYIHKRDVFRFAQQWLSEGVPFAFRDEPIVFERARDALAQLLGESPKHISMTGSARLGYSLSPAQFGQPFDSRSDLDLFIVSARLFALLAVDGNEFARRVRSGDAVPNTAQEREWWQETADRMADHVEQKHFIDHKLIPRRERYVTVDKISRSIIIFEQKLALNTRDPKRWRTSVRVYRDWDAAMRQIGGTLLGTLGRMGFKIEAG